MSSFDVRVPDPAEDVPLGRIVSAAFGIGYVEPTDDEAIRRDRMRPRDRRLVVVDHQSDEVVGGCLAYPFSMTMPGGDSVPVAGLAGVGIAGPHGGRGAMRALVEEHLRQSLAHGDLASVLMASESGIYGRFGYGMATEYAQWETRSSEMVIGATRPTDSRPNISMLAFDTDELRSAAIAQLSTVYDAWAAQVPGALDRSDDWWELVLAPTRTWAGGGRYQLAAIHHDPTRGADGYLLYRVQDNDETTSGHGRANGVARVHELVATTPEAEIDLIRYALSIPLTRTMEWELAPVEPLVQHVVRDRRQFWQKARLDMMWLRPLDPVGLLERRSYRVRSSVSFRLRDPLFPDLEGPWTLTATGGTGTVEPADEAEVELGVAEFGSLLLGTLRATTLSRAGAIAGPADAIRRLDMLLQTDQRPFNLQKF